MSARQVRRFQLERDVDVSGVSGTGVVAFGVQAPDGTCVLWWNSEHDSIAIYPSMETLLAIHGHGGMTRAVYIDDMPAAEDGAGASGGGGSGAGPGTSSGAGSDTGAEPGPRAGASGRSHRTRAGGTRSGAVQGRPGAARFGAGRAWRPRTSVARGSEVVRMTVRGHARVASLPRATRAATVPSRGQAGS